MDTPLTAQDRRFRLLHPALSTMQEANARLVCRNLEYIERAAELQKRISLLEEQRRISLARTGDCLEFLRDLRRTIKAAGDKENDLARDLDRSIELFLDQL